MSKLKTKSSVEAFKEAVKKWEDLSVKCGNFGASDTEPDTVFQWCISQASKGEDFDIPRSARDWQLYTGMPGVGRVATRLTTSLQRCLDTLNKVTMAEHKELRKYLNGFIWRC